MTQAPRHQRDFLLGPGCMASRNSASLVSAGWSIERDTKGSGLKRREIVSTYQAQYPMGLAATLARKRDLCVHRDQGYCSRTCIRVHDYSTLVDSLLTSPVLHPARHDSIRSKHPSRTAQQNDEEPRYSAVVVEVTFFHSWLPSRFHAMSVI